MLDISPACPSEVTLRELARMRTPSPESASVRAHLAGCAACREAFARFAPTALDVNAPTQPAPLSGGPLEEDSSSFALVTVEAGRYVLRGERARGGMGRILEAWDRRHQRAVALKVLLHSTDEARTRFLREVRITARLQHPGIVPLYDAGRWLDGEPFFAMKLVEGRSLAEVFFDAKTANEKLALLPNLIAMTEALAYAHDSGIIHRDLKPSNVLLGAFGETVVIDWGIAKELGAPDEPRDEAAFAAGVEGFHTHTGLAVGTVGYMSPEQAVTASVDPRADVYSLGAVLYHLFTGTPPHPSASVKESFEKLMSGPPEPLGELAPNLAPELVTIIEKAMARDPADRYQDARAMAEDMRRFQEGKLVQAHSYSLGSLLRRRIARHRAVFATAAVLLVALLVTVTVSVRRIVRERDAAAAARAETEKARATAVAQRDAAEKLVDFVVNDLKQKLEAVGRLDLTAGIGEEVDKYYQSASASTNDAPTLVRRAQALQLVAVVADQRLDEKAAQPMFEHAIALAERALEIAPADSPAQIAAINMHVSLAGSLLDLGRLDEAEKHARRAVEIGRAAVKTNPNVSSSAGALARADLRVALVLRTARRGSEVAPFYAEACSLLEAAFAKAPDNLPLHRQLGWAYFERGDAAIERGDLDDAGTSLARSVEVRRALYARDPTPDRADDLAWARLLAAHVSVQRGEFDAGVQAMAETVAELAKTAAADPGKAISQRNLADALGNLAREKIDVGRCADAIGDAQRGAEVLDVLARKEPNAQSTALLLGALATLGDAELCAGRSHDARATLERASTQYAKAADPKLAMADEAMDAIGPSLARAQLGDGAREAAYETAQAAVTRATARARGATDYAPLQALGLAQAALGDVDVARGDADHAAAAYRAAYDAFASRASVSHNALVDPVITAEAAIKLAGSASKAKAKTAPDARANGSDASPAHRPIDDAVPPLEALDRAHRLVPRGAAALAEARTLVARTP